MNKNDKGLEDNNDAEFILNESGTSVSNDMDEVAITQIEMPELQKENEKEIKPVTIVPVVSNDIASDAYSRGDEDSIKPFSDSFPDDKNFENKDKG